MHASVQWGMRFSQCLSLCRLTRTCRYFTFVAHNAPGPVVRQGSKCRSRKSCSDCLLYRTCPKRTTYGCRGCLPKTYALVSRARKMPTTTPSDAFSWQTFKPTPTPLHTTSAFLSEMPTVRAPARAHNTPVPTSSQADLAFAAHIQPVWSAANVYCDHKRRLNKERWGIDPAQCKAKCIALKACRSYTSVVDAPGPLAEIHGGTDCLLWDDCLSLKRYQCDKCHAVTHMLPGPGSHPPLLFSNADVGRAIGIRDGKVRNYGVFWAVRWRNRTHTNGWQTIASVRTNPWSCGDVTLKDGMACLLP